ncbi:hypothetical protein D5278_17725 [bacterium 1XD21-13]|nr:hypothetical protein [bacterium 1XD21-13]
MGYAENVLKKIEEMYGYLSVVRMNAHKKKNGLKSTKPRVLGDKIAVLGNGKSQQLFWDNIERFRDYDILCVNSFICRQTDLFFKYKPKYYCAVDGCLFSEERAKRLGGTNEEDYYNIRKVLEDVTWKMYIITFDIYDIIINNRNIEIIKINQSNTPYVGQHVKKLYEKNLATIGAESVAVTALFFSVVFGYKEIALFGVDHDNFKGLVNNINNEVLVETWHSYNTSKPDYVKIREGVGEQYIYLIFEGYTTLFKSYLLVAELAKEMGAEILNYNVNSYIDAFNKVRLK